MEEDCCSINQISMRVSYTKVPGINQNFVVKRQVENLHLEHCGKIVHQPTATGEVAESFEATTPIGSVWNCNKAKAARVDWTVTTTSDSNSEHTSTFAVQSSHLLPELPKERLKSKQPMTNSSAFTSTNSAQDTTSRTIPLTTMKTSPTTIIDSGPVDQLKRTQFLKDLYTDSEDHVDHSKLSSAKEACFIKGLPNEGDREQFEMKGHNFKHTTDTHRLFKTVGVDLYSTVTIGIRLALLGGYVKIHDYNGYMLTIQVPRNTETGYEYRIAGAGLPVPTAQRFSSKKSRGDLIITFYVRMPSVKLPKQVLQQLSIILPPLTPQQSAP